MLSHVCASNRQEITEATSLLTCSPASFSSLWASMDRLTFAAQICAVWRRPCQDTIIINFGDTPNAVGSTDDFFLTHALHCVHTHCASIYMNNSSRPPCPYHCKAQLRHATWLLCPDRSAQGLLPAGSHHAQLAASAPASCVVQHAPTMAAASTSCSLHGRPPSTCNSSVCIDVVLHAIWQVTPGVV